MEGYWRIYAVVAAALIASIIIHMPVEVQEQVFRAVVNPSPVYNDVYSSYYKGVLASPCTSAVQWVNQDARAMLCLGRRVFPVPYLDYKLPEAPLAGLAWLGLTGLAYLLAGDVLSPSYAAALYIVQSLASSLSVLTALVLLHRWTRGRDLGGQLPIGLASVIVYGVYGFDSIALPLYILFVSSLLDKKYSRALLLSSVLTAWNPFFTVLLGLTIAYMAFEPGSLKDYAGLAAAPAAYAALYLASPPSFENLVSKYVSPVFNSSIYWLFTGAASPQALYAAAWGVASSLILILYGLRSTNGGLADHAASIVAAAWILNPVAVPQTVLFIIPLLHLRGADRRVQASALASELLNALVIITWFHDAAIRSALNHYMGLGLPVENNPASASSPVFWIIQARNALVIALTARLIADYWEGLKNQGKH